MLPCEIPGSEYSGEYSKKVDTQKLTSYAKKRQ